MLGCKIKLECMSCGNIFDFKEVIQETKSKYVINSYKRKCSCGARDNFRTLEFKQQDVKIGEGVNNEDSE